MAAKWDTIDPNTLDLIGVLTQYESVQWLSPFNQKEIECLYHEYLELLHATLQNPDREKL